MLLDFSPVALADVVAQSDATLLPLEPVQTADELLAMLQNPIFDPDTVAKRILLDADVDQRSASALNFYRDVTAAEATDFYTDKLDEDPERPVSWRLDSQLVKEDGQLNGRTWKVCGMYGTSSRSSGSERIIVGGIASKL